MRGRRRRKPAASAPGVWDWASGLLPAALQHTLHEGVSLGGKAMHLATHPVETSALARKAFGLAGELGRLGLLEDDPPTRLKRPLSGIRHAAWADPLPLAELRTLGRVLGCTVNDVLMSTLAGALGRYLAARGDAVTGLTIRATVPVNLRPESDGPPALGNCFGLVFVDLPIGIRHPLERLYAVHAAMQQPEGLAAGAGHPRPAAGGGQSAGCGRGAGDRHIQRQSQRGRLESAGAKQQLFLAGAPLTQLLFWVPQAGDIGTGISMLSYNGGVQFGVMADRQLVPKPAELVAEIGREFERLALVVLLGAERVID